MKKPKFTNKSPARNTTRFLTTCSISIFCNKSVSISMLIDLIELAGKMVDWLAAVWLAGDWLAAGWPIRCATADQQQNSCHS